MHHTTCHIDPLVNKEEEDRSLRLAQKVNFLQGVASRQGKAVGTGWQGGQAEHGEQKCLSGMGHGNRGDGQQRRALGHLTVALGNLRSMSEQAHSVMEGLQSQVHSIGLRIEESDDSYKARIKQQPEAE
ncbi:hypothetical protein PUN28_001871 [Cardiocondyla obscurior]|uniref:Uncharacterized protein n=1 Tax=Cardiocondyla obscurior TaxID=286306 RepID=A0AAW2GRJ8_9HYME